MPRKGPAYPITKEWQGWVRERIEQLKEAGEVRSQNALAAKAGISNAALSEALSEEAVQTTVMPEIHKALGWPRPLLTPPIYVLHLVEYFERLPAIEQGQWLERLRSEVREERKASESRRETNDMERARARAREGSPRTRK